MPVLATVGLSAALVAAGVAPLAAQTQPIDYKVARLERRIVPARAAGPIKLDGTLDEPAWADAPVARGFIQKDPREDAPATYDTEVRVLYDDDALYFGVFAKDDGPGGPIVADLKKDFATGSSDGFRVVLDTFKDGRNSYEFGINPAGAKWDAQSANEGREVNANWDGIWEVRTRLTETGWYAEIKIPFRSLKFSDADPQTWGLNFERKLRRLNEDSYWSPLPRIYNAERVSLAGTLEGMRGLHPGRNIRVKPYTLGSSNAITGAGTDGDFDAGLDVKYGVTSGLTWDFTVNTDFSQVEADEQQVNLSRFNLFFPEKRDFFLENSGIFQFGSTEGGGGGTIIARQNMSQDMRLFFSRRIGLSDAGNAIPILAGTRLTGRVGRYSVGALNIQQREQGGVPSTNFAALRLHRDILANSDIGVVVLNKDGNGPHYNRVAGLDANFRFGFLNVNGYAAKTFSPQSVTPGSGEDFAARSSFNYNSRVWQFRGNYTAIGDRFTDEMGFVPRRGVDTTLLYAGRAVRSRWLSKLGVRESRVHWQMEMFRRRRGGLDSRYQDWHVPFSMQDGGFIEFGKNTNVEEIRKPFTLNSASGVTVNPGRYEFSDLFILWNTSSAARVSLNTRYSDGSFYEGTRRSWAVGSSVRLNEHFNASVNLQVNDVKLPTGAFVSKLVTSRLNYNFNTRMFVNALVQYNSDSRQLSSNLRLNLIHRPLSDFFLVYNDMRNERTGEPISRALIAKMTYLVAF